MKIRFVVLLIFILSLFTFCGCSKAADTVEPALTVGGTGIDTAVFSYFLDTQIKSRGDGPDREEAITNAEALCADYVKINSEFADRGLVLSTVNKATIASNTDEVWRMYGKYYEKIGVGKDTVTKIKTGEMYKDILITSVFGSGGDSEISDEKMKEYFNENYVFFRYFSYILTGDEEIDKAIRDTFHDLLKSIGKEDEDTEEEITFTDLYKKFMDSETNVAGSLEPTSVKKGSDAFPQVFFESVSAMKTDEIKIITSGEYIYMVQKCDGSGQFSDYKSSILEYLTDTDFDTLMAEKYGSVSVVGNRSVEKDCYKRIQDTKVK